MLRALVLALACGSAAALHRAALPYAPMRANFPGRMVAASPVAPPDAGAAPELKLLSGLQGKAMRVEPSDIPTKKQVRDAVPAHCFKRDTKVSLMYAAISVAQVRARSL